MILAIPTKSKTFKDFLIYWIDVESDVLIEEHIENISDSVRQISRENKIFINDISFEKDEVIFKFIDNNINEIKKELIKNYREVNISINNNIMKVIITENFKKSLTKSRNKAA